MVVNELMLTSEHDLPIGEIIDEVKSNQTLVFVDKGKPEYSLKRKKKTVGVEQRTIKLNERGVRHLIRASLGNRENFYHCV